jgi:hypothetical protein
MKATSRKSAQHAAIRAAAHRTNVEAAAAADRHARDFTAMFAISVPAAAMTPSAQYMTDLSKRS